MDTLLCMYQGVINFMTRTTIMLPEGLKMRALRNARQNGISLGEFIRQAMEKVLRQPTLSREPDPFWADKRVWTGPCPPDLSANVDKYLYGDEK